MLVYRCFSGLLLLTVFYVVRSEEAAKKDDDEQQVASGRSLRGDFGVDQWRAVPEHQMETHGWIATDTRAQQQDASDGQSQKRRRLRKRKRRPQPIIPEPQPELQPRNRRRRPPVRLDEIRDSWKEMEAESPKRANTRRRVSPVYQPESTSKTVEVVTPTTVKMSDSSEEKVRDPYVALQEAEERLKRKKMRQSTTTNAPTSVQDIKALLKQSAGASLSEVLQKRNVSLSDLLRGKHQAVAALTARPEVVTSTAKTTLKDDDVIDKGALNAQRKRFGMMYSTTQNKIYSDVTKYDVITEAATEKRIFVPSHPKYYTSLNYRPNFADQLMKSTMTTSTSTTTTQTPKVVNVQKVPTTVKSTKTKLPITSAKLSKTVKKPEPGENKLPQQAIKIDINEIFGLKEYGVVKEVKKEEVTSQPGPLKMLFDLEELVKQNMESSNTIIPIETTTKSYVTTRATKRTTVRVTKKPTQEKLKKVSAKDEILEILKDEIAKENLSKILRMRNMTVDELVELRERGSSQRHLADIFHNKTREPEPKVEHVGEIHIGRDRQPKSGAELPIRVFPSQIDILPLAESEEIITSEKIPGTSFPTYKIESDKRSKETEPLHIPIWKTIYPGVYNDPPAQKDVFEAEIQKIDEIENTLSEGLSIEAHKNNYDYDDFIQLPIGVKSAIFASLAIIGISLAVFLTILMIFKWTQRHKKHLWNSGSFSCSKIKSPILDSDSKRSIRTFMSETLGKKSIYASRLQSMSDSWDNDKPYQ